MTVPQQQQWHNDTNADVDDKAVADTICPTQLLAASLERDDDASTLAIVILM
jgi:hypothetical protein